MKLLCIRAQKQCAGFYLVENEYFLYPKKLVITGNAIPVNEAMSAE